MALNNRSENRSGETFCSVVTREELPYVAWLTYKWTIALREKSLLHVKPGAVSLLVKKGLHRISSRTLPIRLEENSKCTNQVVSGRKRPDYLKCTCCDPPQWVSVSNTEVKGFVFPLRFSSFNCLHLKDF